MNSFIIVKNEFLKQDTVAYFHYDYIGFGHEGNPDFINHLKNQFGSTDILILKNAVNQLKKVLKEDFCEIKKLNNNKKLTVCVVPRAKSEDYYSEYQKLFKKTISNVVDEIGEFVNGTNYIIRHTNTRTTHLNRSGYGGDGEMPYIGITKSTCNISKDVLDKDILLVDDIYTLDINIDEDAIQALLDNGAKSVIFYAVAKTVKTKNKNTYFDDYVIF